jgi:putative DNA primase/helicase
LQHYGSPLRAWLDLLTTKRSEVERAVRNFQADFLKRNVPAGTCGEVSRGAQRFALIAAAGEIATEAGITGWQPEEGVNGVVRCYQSWLDLRGTSGATDTKAGISQVRQFLEAHGTSRFQSIGFGPNARGGGIPADAQLIRDRAGFRRRNPDNDETEYLIFQETFKNEICSGQNYRHVRETLERHGYLVRDHPHWTVKPRQLPEMPTGLRVYCIRAAILEDVE